MIINIHLSYFLKLITAKWSVQIRPFSFLQISSSYTVFIDAQSFSYSYIKIFRR